MGVGCWVSGAEGWGTGAGERGVGIGFGFAQPPKSVGALFSARAPQHPAPSTQHPLRRSHVRRYSGRWWWDAAVAVEPGAVAQAIDAAAGRWLDDAAGDVCPAATADPARSLVHLDGRALRRRVPAAVAGP